MQSYYAKLLGELNEQRQRDFFCDCSIIVEGRIFKAHRNILFANSGYFRALLIHYIQDSGRHSTASLDIVTSDAFSTILAQKNTWTLGTGKEGFSSAARNVSISTKWTFSTKRHRPIFQLGCAAHYTLPWKIKQKAPGCSCSLQTLGISL